jgi:hypothetical protein
MLDQAREFSGRNYIAWDREATYIERRRRRRRKERVVE